MKYVGIEDGDFVVRVPLVPVMWVLLMAGGIFAVYGPHGTRRIAGFLVLLLAAVLIAMEERGRDG